MKKMHHDINYSIKDRKKSVFIILYENYELCDNVCFLDSGGSLHMCNNKIWFSYLIPEDKDIFQAGKNLK